MVYANSWQPEHTVLANPLRFPVAPAIGDRQPVGILVRIPAKSQRESLAFRPAQNPFRGQGGIPCTPLSTARVMR